MVRISFICFLFIIYVNLLQLTILDNTLETVTTNIPRKILIHDTDFITLSPSFQCWKETFSNSPQHHLNTDWGRRGDLKARA